MKGNDFHAVFRFCDIEDIKTQMSLSAARSMFIMTKMMMTIINMLTMLIITQNEVARDKMIVIMFLPGRLRRCQK